MTGTTTYSANSPIMTIELDTRISGGHSTSNLADTSKEQSGTDLSTTGEIADEAAVSSEIILPRNESFLPAVDRGFGAYSFLAAAFIVEGVVWGFPYAFGVFLEAYLKDSTYTSQKHATILLPLIGNVATGLIYCSGVVVNSIITRYPYLRPTLSWIGSAMCLGSLFGASYTTNIVILIILQGILYAIGGALVYGPCISYLPEWFVHRRGFANGVIFAGTAVGGLVLPLILPPLINAYGIPKTLRILTISMTVILIPSLPFVKGRIPDRRAAIHGPAPRGSGREWIKNPLFWLMMVANTVQGFAYFVPFTWLPTFATDMNLSSSSASLTLACVNGFSIFSHLTIGYFSDKFNPWMLALVGLSSTSIASFILWGVLSYSLGGLLSFAIAYGILATGWSSLWAGFIRPIAQDDHHLNTTLFGYLLLSRGLGNILSTPIATRLQSVHVNVALKRTSGFRVGGGRFEPMIIYVGSSFAVAALIAATGWTVDVRKKRAVT
ncbi:major facilitator superfamily domain-containing protein [Mycena floridula]|nr:major facilitator superfamily domain-containing protein [Mycena floridula]